MLTLCCHLECVGLPVAIRVAKFLAAKYGRLLSIRDIRQGQYDAISCVGLCVYLFRSIVTMTVSVTVCKIFSANKWCELENRVRVRPGN